jgi:hypothetical protein
MRYVLMQRSVVVTSVLLVAASVIAALVQTR